MEKRYKAIIIFESIMLFILITLIGINILFNRLLSDNKAYLRKEFENVKIYEIGKPVFFSGSTVRIQYEDYIFETEIYNDGAALSEENYEIVKKDGFYEVTLKGCEHNDITYYLKVE